jgi:hypothetical protein
VRIVDESFPADCGPQFLKIHPHHNLHTVDC